MAKERYVHGRHTSAYILLFLAQESAYGLTLLNKMEEQIPHNNIDGSAIYRALKDLENSGFVQSYWDTNDPGPAKKWYQITEAGLQELDEFKTDIEMRVDNLQFFLRTYQELFKGSKHEDKKNEDVNLHEKL